MIYLDLIRRFWPFALAAVLFSAGFITGHHTEYKASEAKLEALQRDYDSFVAEVAAKGKAAQARSQALTTEYQHDKEVADHDYQTSIASLHADNQRLLDQNRARGSYLPPPAPAASRPDIACLDRAQFERATEQFVTGLQAIAAEGDDNIAALTEARRWAATLPNDSITP